MPELRSVQFQGKIAGGASIEFLSVDVPVERGVPFVLVHFTLKGEVQKLGLRLDLHKRAFLDHFEEQDREKVLEDAAPKIVQFLSVHR